MTDLCKTPCRFYRVDEEHPTGKCRNKKARGSSSKDCEYFVRRWPIGIQIPELKKPD